MKLIVVACAVILASVSFAQFLVHTGPASISPINGKLDGAAKHVWSLDRIGATLYWDESSDDVMFGVNATFRVPVKGPASFWLVLCAASKSDKPAFGRFEVFDFTVREWIEVGATNEGSSAGYEIGSFMSTELKRSRFVHPTSGEIWARTIFNAKYAPVVWIDQFAVLNRK